MSDRVQQKRTHSKRQNYFDVYVVDLWKLANDNYRMSCTGTEKGA